MNDFPTPGARLLLGLFMGVIGLWSIFHGLKAIKERRFVFSPSIFDRIISNHVDGWYSTLFKKGYPTVTGIPGILIGIFFVLIGTPFLGISMYYVTSWFAHMN